MIPDTNTRTGKALIKLAVFSLVFVGVSSARASDLFNLETARQHWAFRLFEEVKLSKVEQSGWGMNQIDRFVLTRLEKAGLQPSAPADKALLIRRVYFDLIGLPPSPE
jgi:hypothetical protein